MKVDDFSGFCVLSTSFLTVPCWEGPREIEPLQITQMTGRRGRCDVGKEGAGAEIRVESKRYANLPLPSLFARGNTLSDANGTGKSSPLNR